VLSPLPIRSSWSGHTSTIPPATRGILGTPGPIELSPNPSCAAMIELVKTRGRRVPPHPTAASLTRLIAMYNGELINSGNYLIKRMLKLTLARDGEQRSLRRSVLEGPWAFRRAFLAQRDATRESSGFALLNGCDGRHPKASTSLPATPPPPHTAGLLRSTSPLRLPPSSERSGGDLSPYKRTVLPIQQ